MPTSAGSTENSSAATSITVCEVRRAEATPSAATTEPTPRADVNNPRPKAPACKSLGWHAIRVTIQYLDDNLGQHAQAADSEEGDTDPAIIIRKLHLCPHSDL